MPEPPLLRCNILFFPTLGAAWWCHGFGAFVGTLFMFYLIDLSSDISTAYMLIAGLTLVLLTCLRHRGLSVNCDEKH